MLTSNGMGRIARVRAGEIVALDPHQVQLDIVRLCIGKPYAAVPERGIRTPQVKPHAAG